MKITRSTYIFDEELNLKKFLKTILEEEHENCVFLAEENWFNFSDLQTLELDFFNFSIFSNFIEVLMKFVQLCKNLKKVLTSLKNLQMQTRKFFHNFKKDLELYIG